MHTYEYEISLVRELKVCKKYIHSLQQILRKIERKHDVVFDEFVKRYLSGTSAPITGISPHGSKLAGNSKGGKIEKMNLKKCIPL